MIALENLMTAVLAEGSDRQLQVARKMAESISPRPGFTQHPLTIQAAGHMSTSSIAQSTFERKTDDCAGAVKSARLLDDVE